MRLIYICDRCANYIDEIEMNALDEGRLGFDILTEEEREDLVHLDWQRQVGTVKAICDACLAKLHDGDVSPRVSYGPH
ncbi:MAG: hypothetical protein JG781_741 [Peptococcaceae bacterium]|nr:hypothetical protein [Peptococcaceae bacterium]